MIEKINLIKKLPLVKRRYIKLVSSYKIGTNNGKDVFVKVRTNNILKNEYKTIVKANHAKSIARTNFEFDKKSKILHCSTMDVFDKKQRGKGYGIVMHLMNIMELMENNFNKIELIAMPNAILFHGKCKFAPVLKDFHDILTVMLAISKKNTNKYKDLKPVIDKAGKYFDEVYSTSGVFCLNDDKLKYANEIAKEYLEIISTKKLSPEEKKEYGLNHVIYMELTKEEILKNKDFFNKLFKKFMIDYKI